MSLHSICYRNTYNYNCSSRIVTNITAKMYFNTFYLLLSHIFFMITYSSFFYQTPAPLHFKCTNYKNNLSVNSNLTRVFSNKIRIVIPFDGLVSSLLRRLTEFRFCSKIMFQYKSVLDWYIIESSMMYYHQVISIRHIAIFRFNWMFRCR